VASRSSPFHKALHRPRLIMGVEKGMFGCLALVFAMLFGMRLYSFLPLLGFLYFVGRWLTKVDDQYVAVLSRYLQEEHVYDATPRPSDADARPKGWGRGLHR
jgi:type IV secretory pathway TrbD component